MSLGGWVLGAAAGLGLVAGLLIGSIGVGGIILVPSLIELPIAAIDEDRVSIAVASCMFSYIFVGLAGGFAYTRQKSVAWSSTAWILVGAVPGGAAGAVAVGYVKAIAIKIVLYSLVMLSAVYSMYRTIRDVKMRKEITSDTENQEVNGTSGEKEQ